MKHSTKKRIVKFRNLAFTSIGILAGVYVMPVSIMYSILAFLLNIMFTIDYTVDDLITDIVENYLIAFIFSSTFYYLIFFQ